MSRRHTLVVVSNDLPDSDYGATRLAAAFGAAFETRVMDPTAGFGEADRWFAACAPDALVLSGSDRSVKEKLPWMLEEQEVVRLAGERRVPVLGVCFGHQLVAAAFGAEILTKKKRVGIFDIEVEVDDPVLGRAGDRLSMPEQNAEYVSAAPAGFEVVARSAGGAIEALRGVHAPVYGVQFHPCYAADVLDVDEAWAGFERSRFRHDGGPLLSRAAAHFRFLCDRER